MADNIFLSRVAPSILNALIRRADVRAEEVMDLPELAVDLALRLQNQLALQNIEANANIKPDPKPELPN